MTLHAIDPDSAHPSLGGAVAGETSPVHPPYEIFLSDYELEMLTRSLAVKTGRTQGDISEDEMTYGIVMAVRLGLREIDAAGRTAVTDAYRRAEVIREPF